MKIAGTFILTLLAAGCASTAKDSFVVASFNIRIDTDKKGNPVDIGDNAWTARRPRIAKSVLSDSIDVCETPHAGPALSSHGYSQESGLRLDYIFVTDGFRVLSHRTHDDRPGGKYPSDHDAVSARVDFVGAP